MCGTRPPENPGASGFSCFANCSKCCWPGNSWTLDLANEYSTLKDRDKRYFGLSCAPGAGGLEQELLRQAQLHGARQRDVHTHEVVGPVGAESGSTDIWDILLVLFRFLVRSECF